MEKDKLLKLIVCIFGGIISLFVFALIPFGSWGFIINMFFGVIDFAIWFIIYYKWAEGI